MSVPRFVDAHMHLWQLDRLAYPWLRPPFGDDGPNGSVAPIARDYDLKNYVADAGTYRPDKMVHIDAGAGADDALAETQWLQSLAGDSGYPQAIVAFAPLDDPEVESLLAAHVESPNVRGIRHLLNWHPDPKRTYTPRDLLAGDAFARGYSLLAKYGLSFDLQIYPGQMARAAALAARHPDVPVILNHMGMPIDADRSVWRQGLEKLAELPHAVVKISGFGFVDRHWTTEGMRPLVLDLIDHFGTGRVMFASDFPTDRLWNSFGQAMAAYDDITQDFSADERAALFAGNAERIYRI